MNLNELAKAICALEGKKVELNIGQVKEVLLCLGKVLVNQQPYDQADLIGKLIARGARRLGMVKSTTLAGMYFLPDYKKRK
ncbi:MAG: hypothetical protein NTX25_21530 [Proteobacteria bacterium]|nr:hypothetical protein [Pseudomonadota bacterium]